MDFLEQLWTRQCDTLRTNAKFHADRLPEHADSIHKQADEFCGYPVPKDTLQMDLHRVAAESLRNSWKRLGAV